LICHQASYTAAGRLNAVASIGPTPSQFIGGFGFDASNNLLIDTNAAAGGIADAGIRMSAAGAIYGTTTVAGTDVFCNGLRFSNTGQLVYVQANPTYVQNGNPFDANGALCIA